MKLTLFFPDSTKRRNDDRDLPTPRPRHVTGHPRPSQPPSHHQRTELVPNLWHAHVRRHGVQVHHENEQTVPVVAPCIFPSHVWLRLLLRGGGHSFPRQLRRLDRWGCSSNHFCLPELHVAQDQETQWVHVVAELGAWDGGCSPHCSVCVSWGLCGYRYWYPSQLL